MKKSLQIPLIGMPVVDNRNGCANVYQSTHTQLCTHTDTDSVHTFYSSLGFRMLPFVLGGGVGLVSQVTKMNADAIITLRSLWCIALDILV